MKPYAFAPGASLDTAVRRRLVTCRVIDRRRLPLVGNLYRVAWTVIQTWDKPGDAGQYLRLRWRRESKIYGHLFWRHL